MTVDPTIGSLLAALAQLPDRLTALEREAVQVKAQLEAVRGLLPAPLRSVSDAAAAIGVSVQTMRRWIRSGQARSVRIGGIVRVDVSQFKSVDTATIAALARATRRRRTTGNTLRAREEETSDE